MPAGDCGKNVVMMRSARRVPMMLKLTSTRRRQYHHEPLANTPFSGSAGCGSVREGAADQSIDQLARGVVESWSRRAKNTLLVRLHVYPAHHGKEGCQCTAPDADCASTTDPQHILCAQHHSQQCMNLPHLHTLPFPRQAAGRGLARLYQWCVVAVQWQCGGSAATAHGTAWPAWPVWPVWPVCLGWVYGLHDLYWCACMYSCA